MLLRIWLALIVVISGYFLTLWFNINSHTNMAYDARKNELRHIVNLAKNTIQPLIDQQNAGLLTKEESMRAGIDILNRMTFLDSYGNNYIFMTTYDGTMRVIPFEPQRLGCNQWDMQDSHGKYLIRELVKLTKSSAGEGFSDYFYLPPHSQRISLTAFFVIFFKIRNPSRKYLSSRSFISGPILLRHSLYEFNRMDC